MDMNLENLENLENLDTSQLFFKCLWSGYESWSKKHQVGITPCRMKLTGRRIS